MRSQWYFTRWAICDIHIGLFFSLAKHWNLLGNARHIYTILKIGDFLWRLFLSTESKRNAISTDFCAYECGFFLFSLPFYSSECEFLIFLFFSNSYFHRSAFTCELKLFLRFDLRAQTNGPCVHIYEYGGNLKKRLILAHLAHTKWAKITTS